MHLIFMTSVAWGSAHHGLDWFSQNSVTESRQNSIPESRHDLTAFSFRSLNEGLKFTLEFSLFRVWVFLLIGNNFTCLLKLCMAQLSLQSRNSSTNICISFLSNFGIAGQFSFTCELSWLFNRLEVQCSYNETHFVHSWYHWGINMGTTGFDQTPRYSVSENIVPPGSYCLMRNVLLASSGVLVNVWYVFVVGRPHCPPPSLETTPYLSGYL